MSNMLDSLVKNRIFPNEEDVIKHFLGLYYSPDRQSKAGNKTFRAKIWHVI